MLAAMILFVLTFTAVLLGAAWFTAVTWCRFFGVYSLYWIWVPMIAWGAYVPLLLAGRFVKSGVLDVCITVSSVLLGFLNFLFFAALACWLALGLVKLCGAAISPRAIGIALYGLGALAAVYGLVNAANLRIVRETVCIRNLPAAWQGRDVAIVSDIHVGRVLGRGFVERIVNRLNEEKPFVVFVPGDMFDGPEAEPDAAMEPWKTLQAPGGAYAVSGNHDEFGNRTLLLAAMSRAGLHVLADEKVCVDGVQILGVYDGELHNRERYSRVLDSLHIDPAIPAILLAHRPEQLALAEKAGVSLQISGHTHGGQFWPWNFVVNRIYGRAAHGLSQWGSLQLYTSYGAGTWGPPMRVATRAEIVILHLECAPAPEASAR